MLEREKAKLGELMHQEQIMTGEIQKMTVLITDKFAEMAEAQQACDFTYTEMYEKYLRKLAVERRQKQQELAEHRKLVYQQKSNTVDAFRKKSIMDKLEDKHKKAYSFFIDQQELKSIEDIVLTRKAAKAATGEDED